MVDKSRLALIIVIFFSAIVTTIHSDNVPPSSDPPGGLKPEEVPMFVAIGWDDNSHAGFAYPGVEGQSIHWVRTLSKPLTNPAGVGNDKTYDGAPVRFSFFNNSVYVANSNMGDYVQQVKVAWNMCYLEGHEVGNHTHSHITNYQGPQFSVSQWQNEINLCTEWLTKEAPPLSDSTSIENNNTTGAGIPENEIYGFRAPYLYYNDNSFSALEQEGFIYDCSIEDGFQDTMDGTNYLWPYTLDNGSPGHDYLKENNLLNDKMKHVTITSHPGLWEMPDHPVIVPPDEVCSDYGIQPGLREKIKSLFSWFDVNSGKITGLDYNLWNGFRLNKDETLATLKYTLDLRLQGNRAPFLFGAHSQYYNSLWQGLGEPDVVKRQQCIEEFIEYALSKPDVRMVPFIDIIRWCRNPVALNSTPVSKTQKTIQPYAQILMQNRTVLIVFNEEVSGKNVTVSLFNLMGKLEDKKSIQINNKNSAALKIKNNLSAGIYILHVTGNGNLTKKISLAKN